MVNTLFQRDNSKPLYRQLKELILQQIHTGIWPEGAHLPTEFEMKKEYGLSRATIRQALDELEKDGIIERKRRAGTIVSPQRVRPELIKLTSFSEDIRSRGLVPESKTLSTDLLLPPIKVQTAFGIEPNEKVWRVLRLRSASGEPYGLHELYLPPQLQFSPREVANLSSYYELLSERHNLKPSYATEQLTASVTSKQEASLLGIDVNAPLLVAWRVTYSEDNQAIECVKILYRADRYEYTIQLFS